LIFGQFGKGAVTRRQRRRALLNCAIGLGASDRDDRLLGKGLQQRDLTVGEAAGFQICHGDGASRAAIPDQWDRNSRTGSRVPSRRRDSRLPIGISDVHNLLVPNGKIDAGTGILVQRPGEHSPESFVRFRRGVIRSRCAVMYQRSVVFVQIRVGTAAQRLCPADNQIEHRLRVTG